MPHNATSQEIRLDSGIIDRQIWNASASQKLWTLFDELPWSKRYLQEWLASEQASICQGPKWQFFWTHGGIVRCLAGNNIHGKHGCVFLGLLFLFVYFALVWYRGLFGNMLSKTYSSIFIIIPIYCIYYIYYIFVWIQLYDAYYM